MIMSACLIAMALILCSAGAAFAGTQLLGTPVETNTNITASGDELRVTIPSTADKGGNDATTVTVSLSGTGLNASDVASVAVLYGATEAGRVNSPVLSNQVISLGGTQKGGLDWTFYVDFNSGTNVTNFVYTVETGMGGVDEQGNLPFSTSGATVNVSAGNSPPVLSISQPDGGDDSVNAGDPFSIEYTLTDGDSVATVDFYWDTNNSGADGTAITDDCQGQPEGSPTTCTWNTAGLDGSYYVYGIASDPENGAQPAVYSNDVLVVTASGNTPPTLTIIEPDGIGDSVNAGDPFTIDYTLTDGDSVATVDFYWDTNGSGADGTAITDDCQNQPETPSDCTWNTTGLNGSYYVYGIPSDPENGAQPAVYSGGTLSITGGSNDPPGDPGSLDQLDIGLTSITPGATTNEKTVNVRATSTDPNSDNVQIEVEFADYAGGTGTFNNVATCASGLVGSGTPATATCGNLQSGISYMWQVRAVDTSNDKSNWVGFPPGNPDVVISNTTPELPNFNTDLNQYKLDGSTAIAQDGVTDETAIAVKATVTDADQDNVMLEVEIVVGGAYTQTPNCFGSFVSSGSVATATCANLIDGTAYTWRARTNDGTTTSTWQDWGLATDVTIARNVALDTLMHNSTNLKLIDYGSGDETWGVAGGRYGEFVCETCHTAFDGVTSNIKRIKDSFTTPDGSNWPNGSTTTSSVIFTDSREGTADFADDTGATAADINGVCNVCHTDVNSLHPHWNYTPTNDGHNMSKDCTACHKHVEAFVGSGDCLECHSNAGDVPADKKVESEFAMNSHHIMKTWAEMVAEGSGVACVACHAEGKINADGSAGINGTYHNNAPSGQVVDFYDATDVTRTAVFSVNLTELRTHTDPNHDTANTTFDNFCMSCHRVGGAANIGGGNWPAAYSSTNPFGETSNIRTNSYDQYQKDFTQLGGGLAVYDDFYPGTGPGASSQDNHHAVRGPRYTASYLAPTYLSSSVALYSGATGVVDSSTLHCNDCHSTAFSSHGGNNEYFLQTATEENPSAEHTTWTEYVCIKCHVGVPYSSGTAHTQNGTNYQHDSTLTGINRADTNLHRAGMTCLNCHDGLVGFGGIHGFPDATFDASTGGGDGGRYWKRRFLPGTGMDQPDPDVADGGGTDPNALDGSWETLTVDGKCYNLGYDTNISGCVKHTGMGQNWTIDRTMARPVDY